MWVIQNGVFGKEQIMLESALNVLGIEYELVLRDSYRHYLYNNTKNVFRGSVEFLTDNITNSGITLENYDCTKYYYEYLPWMLNRQHFFVPWGVLDSDCVSDDFNYFKWLDTDKLFIRPNSGKKIFTGNYISKKWWMNDLLSIIDLPGNKEPKENDLILIAPYNDKIIVEVRVLMHKLKPIDAGAYRNDGCAFYMDRMTDFAAKVAKHVNWYPDDFWVMDLAIMDTKYADEEIKIVEINNLFSSGWYDCDYGKVISYIENASE